MGLLTLDAHHELTLPAAWPEAYAQSEAPAVVHHVAYRGLEVTGIAQPAAFAGIVVQPAQTVLALPGWEDAYEVVVDGALHTLFDIEKLIRMLLHGSHLALEVLGSPARALGLEAADQILDWTVNRRHLAPASDSGATLGSPLAPRLAAGDAIDHFRRYLQGLELAQGRLSLRLDVLVEPVDAELRSTVVGLAGDPQRVAEVVPSATLQAMRNFVSEHPLDPAGSALPPGPTDYAALSHWLVTTRLETA